MRSLEQAGSAFSWAQPPAADAIERCKQPTERRIHHVLDAIRLNHSVDEIAARSGIDPWFVDQIALLDEVAVDVGAAHFDREMLLRAKRHGFSDKQIAGLRNMSEPSVREIRHGLRVRPVYKTVDTCAAEFAAQTPYHYSSYDEETEVEPQR